MLGATNSFDSCSLRWILIVIPLVFSSCTNSMNQNSTDSQSTETQRAEGSMETKSKISQVRYKTQRIAMVEQQLANRDIDDERVLAVMKRIPRHEFVPETLQHRAYDDSPLPVGHGQTISQPYIVALMTQLADPERNKKALDVGTGSGYQAAVLAELVKSVHSIEIVEPLATEARERLDRLGYPVKVKHGDGYQGWPAEAPFDIIIVAAAPDHIPQPLVDQLAVGGKMVIPVGARYQKLLVIEKQLDGTAVEKSIAPVAFVPMTGPAHDDQDGN